jgi:hypothetical protein
MSGTSGAQTRGPVAEADPEYYHYMLNSKKSSWTQFTISGNTLTVHAQYSENGTAKSYRTWGIQKSA